MSLSQLGNEMKQLHFVSHEPRVPLANDHLLRKSAVRNFMTGPVRSICVKGDRRNSDIRCTVSGRAPPTSDKSHREALISYNRQ